SQSILPQQYLVLILLVAGGMSWLQMLVWRFSDSPYLSTLASLILVSVMFVLGVSTWGSEKLVPIIPQPFSTMFLILFPLAGIWQAIESVRAARTNSHTSQ
ncbi:MAG: hypothetical protein L3J46_03265, partial [Kangiellaceae bacterium]|nr:hypothetical protein [Kangiellaceae bacterium]